MLNYYSRYNRIKNPRDIESLASLVFRKQLRASSTDEVKQVSHNQSRQSNPRNRSLEEQFSPIKKFKRGQSQQEIQQHYPNLLNFQRLLLQPTIQRQEIFIQQGHDITPVTSSANNKTRNQQSKLYQNENSNYQLQAVQPQQEHQASDFQSDKESLEQLNLINHKSDEEMINYRQFSQPNWNQYEQQSDSLQDALDYRQYAQKIKCGNRVQSPRVKKPYLERSKSDRFRESHIRKTPIKEINMGTNSSKNGWLQIQEVLESDRLNQGKCQPEKAHSNPFCKEEYKVQQIQYSLKFQSNYQLEQNAETGRFADSQYRKNDGKQINRDENSEQLKLESEEGSSSKQQHRFPKVRNNPLQNPVIYESHIESQNSIPAISKHVIDSGKKASFKQMLKTRNFNPRLVTSTILNDKNGFTDICPKKVNFKSVIKANYNTIITQRQKQLDIEQSDTVEEKVVSKQKNKNLLKAFFDQN